MSSRSGITGKLFQLNFDEFLLVANTFRICHCKRSDTCAALRSAKGEWAEMPMLITDEMLDKFCLVTDEKNLAGELKKRYEGNADRLTLYSPFVPGERDEWWRKLTGVIAK